MISFFRKQGIFISHSSTNKSIAEQLCTFMAAMGVNKNKIFCSSIVGQGVDNGEKLNRRIAMSIKESKVVIFMISADFLESPYCIEELGTGWYLAENNILKCYFLVLPDILSISEIQGFVNSKIDKFSFINRREDLGLFAKNLCNELRLQAPDDSSLTDAEDAFFSVAGPLFSEIIDKRKRLDQKKEDRKSALTRLNAENVQLQGAVQHLNDTISQARAQYKVNLLEKEYHTIESDFCHFGGQTGITKQKFEEEGESFWFSMVSRYLDIRKELQLLGRPCLCHENIEILIATIYSAHGDLQESYEHLKIFFQNVRSTIYPSVFKNIVFDDTNDTHELIEIIENRIAKTKKGLIQDSYIKSLDYLIERKKRLEEGADNA